MNVNHGENTLIDSSRVTINKPFIWDESIRKIEDSVYIIQYRLESITDVSKPLDDKTMKRLHKIKAVCEEWHHETMASNNDIVRWMKIKNILEEWKNIFYNVVLLQDIFELLHLLIQKNCIHQKEYDYIDVDPDKSIRICFCKQCFCTL